ncbi:protein spaetzle 5-like [Coccinella septempunctata]|uniref:protein spaetzle 5-like n=1 Tax=Coccinella septempunctata TaxID=41139 RepID=UPI001D06A156|nr:protein spaetzle 5-like [Coccinella septempunctata]
MITRVVFSTCVLICLLEGEPGAASPAVADLTGLDPSLEFDSVASRFRRGNKEEDSLIVETAEDYPADAIREILSESPQLGIFFKRTKVPGFGNRHNSFDQSEDRSMCETSFMTQWPQKLRNRKGKEKFIVNQESSYQPVYVETCKKDVTCTLKEFFPPNFTSECKQKYSVARLVAMNSPTDRNLVVDEFDIACGCVCTIKRT